MTNELTSQDLDRERQLPDLIAELASVQDALAWLVHDLLLACEDGNEDELEELLEDAVRLLAIEVKPIEIEHRQEMAIVYQALHHVADATWADDPPFELTPVIETLAANGGLFYYDIVRVLSMLNGKHQSELTPVYLDKILGEVTALDDPERRVLQVLLRRWKRWQGLGGPGPEAAKIEVRLESRARPLQDDRLVTLTIHVRHAGGRARNVRVELCESDAFAPVSRPLVNLGTLLADEAVRLEATFTVELSPDVEPETLSIEFAGTYDDRAGRGHMVGPVADKILLLWVSEGED
jgi:hypothetical protein